MVIRRALIVLSLMIALAITIGILAWSRFISSHVEREMVTSPVSDAPHVVELYTPWCPTCLKMKPIVEELTVRYAANGVHVEAIDVSQNENEVIADQYDVRAVPTLLFIDKSGQEVARLVGVQSKEQIERALLSAGLGSCKTEV